MATRQVAITGVGLVTPAGIGGREVALAMPPPPSPPESPEVAAGEHPYVLRVSPGFEPREFLCRRKDLKLMARAAQLAVGAAKLALADAGLADADATDAGLFLGVGTEPGNLDDVLDAIAHSRNDAGRLDVGLLAERGMSYMNPLSALLTLPNMSVAHIAINVGAMGPNQALCDGPDGAARAILEASSAIMSGRAPWALAGASDARTDFPSRTAAERQSNAGERPHGPCSEAACVLILEPVLAAKARGARILGYVEHHDGLPEGDFDSLGDCGAARIACAFGRAIASGRRAAFAPVAVCPGEAAGILRRMAGQTAIAVSGVGLRTPLGSDLATFTEALLNGRTGARRIQAFDASRFPIQVACEVPDFVPSAMPQSLWAAVSGLDDRKAELAIQAAAAAVADYGVLPKDAGLIYATGLSSVSVTEMNQDCLPFITEGEHGRFAFDYKRFGETLFIRPQAPWRHMVSRPAHLLRSHFRLLGPSACHFSACAAGAAAIGHAIDLIRRGEAEVMLCGGADSMVHPFGIIPFILLGAISEDPNPATVCRPFDKSRDGFVMGEGAAFFVLEPLERARALGHRVYGVLLGHGTSCDAHSVTAPHPDGAGAERAMRAALTDAGLAPDAVDYVNAHGTGTPLNDLIESAAIERVFGRGGPPVSSSKAQLGHAIAAAGVVEALACLAAFRGGRLPPNAHTCDRDPRVGVDLVEQVARETQAEIIISNSFGFGGQNCSLLLAHPESG